MTQAAKLPEPSMEEILASIRRIIADDDASKTTQREVEGAKPAAASDAPPQPLPRAPEASASERSVADMLAEAPPAPVAPEPEAEAEPEADAEAESDQASDILDLTESMAAPMPHEPAPAPGFAPDPEPQFRKIEATSDISFDDPIEEPPMHSVAEEVRSHDSREVVDRDAEERGRLISRATSAAVDSAFNTLAQTVLVQNARTLEDLVREMLRPMLKSWLDDNLPDMVERLVRAEIERVSRGRMG